MKNTLEGIKSKINEAEEQISELKDRMVEITATEQRKNNEKKWDSPRNFWDNIKCTDINFIGVPEGEKKKTLEIFEDIIAENFSNMRKETQVQEAQSSI